MAHLVVHWVSVCDVALDLQWKPDCVSAPFCALSPVVHVNALVWENKCLVNVVIKGNWLGGDWVAHLGKALCCGAWMSPAVSD